jgi:hypothetical protein
MPERRTRSQADTKGEPTRLEASTLRHQVEEIADHRGIHSRPQSTAEASGQAPLGLSGLEAEHRSQCQARKPWLEHSMAFSELDKALEPYLIFMPRTNVRRKGQSQVGEARLWLSP